MLEDYIVGKRRLTILTRKTEMTIRIDRTYIIPHIYIYIYHYIYRAIVTDADECR